MNFKEQWDGIYYSGEVLSDFMKISSDIIPDESSTEKTDRMMMFDILYFIHESCYRTSSTSDLMWAYRQIDDVYNSVFAFISTYRDCEYCSIEYDDFSERKHVIQVVKAAIWRTAEKKKNDESWDD